MKKLLHPAGIFCLIVFLLFQLKPAIVNGQCTNADFSLGNFNGWTATYGKCSGIPIGGDCFCAGANPTANTGFLQGPLNAPSNSATQYSQTICSSGNDANLALQGVNIPCVYPGNAYSARLGSTTAEAEGETLTYTFPVTTASCNFTYHYAVVLEDGGHAADIAPFFHISVVDGSGNPITCAAFNVDGSSATAIGFDSVPNGGTTIHYKNWTSVFVPLNSYIGQTVKITFTTESCYPAGSGCGGPHYAYAYVAAECGSLQILSSSPVVCGGQNVTLTAPPGAASYAWSGPGVVGAANGQTVIISQPGQYICNMTTFGNPPCPFSLDTIMAASPTNPVANFSAPAVCSGSATTFTNLSTSSSPITAYAWNFGDGSAVVTTQNATHTFSAPGTYHVNLTITATPCSHDTTIDVVVTTPPSSTFTATSPVCEGTNSTVTYTGGAPANYTYTWNFGGGTGTPDTGQGPLAISWATGGTKTITLTVSEGSCSSAQTSQTVTVNPFPGLTLTPHQSICLGDQAQLVASGATNYTWAADPTLSATNTGTVTATPTVTTVYTVTGTSSNCTATDTVSVSVYTAPASSFTIAGPVCVGQNALVTYAGNAGASATYNWNFGTGVATPNSGPGPFQVQWAAGGNPSISLTVTQFGCTSVQTTNSVVVNPAPSAVFTASSPVCTGQNSTVTYSGVPSGTASYVWVFDGATTTGTSPGPFPANWPAAGTKTITLQVTDNGCVSPLDSVEVSVHAYPAAAFLITSTSVCAYQLDTILFTGTASTAANFQWNFSGATVAPGETGAGPYQVDWANSGLQTVTLTVVDSGCTSNVASVPVTVNPTPTASFTTITPICTGQTTTLTYSGTGTGAAAYNWTYDGGIVVSGTNQGPIVVGWPTTGAKHVTLAVSENGCTSPVADSVIQINVTPVAAFTVAPASACVGQTSTVTFTGVADNAAVYTWSFAGGVPATGNTAGPYQITWPAAGAQNITLSVTDNGCNSNDTSLLVTVNPVPPSVAGLPVTFCSGDSAAIGTAPIAGYTYSWSPATGLSNPAIANPNADGTNTTSATIVTNYVVTTSALGCSSSDAVNVTINPGAVPSFTPPTGQCITGNSFSFVAGGTFLPTATFAWNFGPNGTPANSALQNQAVTFGTSGTQTVSLTITQAGCPASTFTDSVSVYPMPVASFTADTIAGCVGLQVCFTNTSTIVEQGTYNWSFGDGQTSALKNPCNTYNAAGKYTVKVTELSANNCSASITMDSLITIAASPVAAFIPPGATIQLPVDTISLYNQSLNATTYAWNFGVLGNSTSYNATLTFPLSGIYPVTLLAYNGSCADSATHNIIVLPPDAFFIPNVFTPNGDGHNDLFYIEAQEGVTVIHFTVFDRWGEKVHDGAYPWDGIYLGKPVPQGVYVYEFQLGLAGQNNGIIRKGAITVLR